MIARRDLKPDNDAIDAIEQELRELDSFAERDAEDEDEPDLDVWQFDPETDIPASDDA